MRSRISETGQSLPEGFYSHLAAQGQSKRSIQNYRGDIREFASWLTSLQKRPLKESTLRNAELEAFRRYLAESHSQSTVTRKVANAKRFVRWAQDQQFPESASGGVGSGRISWEELLKILDRLAAQGNVRDRLIMTLLAHSGLRVSEIVGLTWKDIEVHGSHGLLRAGDRSKHNVRRVELDPQKVQWLEELGYGSKVGSPEPIFHRNGRTMTRSAISVVVDRFSRLAGYKLTPHSFRQIWTQLNIAGRQPYPLGRERRPSEPVEKGSGAKTWVSGRRISDTYQDLVPPDSAATTSQVVKFIALRSHVHQNLKVREAVRRRADRACERCGFVVDDALLLQIHHLISAGERHDSIDNCVALCANCHVLVHWQPRSADVEAELLDYLRRAMPRLRRVQQTASGKPSRRS
jgi:integrase